MDNEQFEKKIDWLENERRKADQNASQLERRIVLLEEALSSNQELANSYKREMSRVNTAAERIASFSKEIRSSKTELEVEIRSNEERGQKRQSDFEIKQFVEQQKLSKAVELLRKDLSQIEGLRSELKAREVGESHLGSRIDELTRSLDEISKNEEQRLKLSASLDESRKQDDKRIAEIEGEISTVVDLSEKTKASSEKLADDHRRVRNQLEDVTKKVEKNQEALDEKTKQLAAEQVSRDHIWSEWESRFKTIEQQSDELAARLKDIETIDLAVKRAQSSFDELVEKINRRVNELTEVQRLGEQRFRQEWSTFQADAQKRWSGFNLGQEESQKEANRQRERLTEQVTHLEDNLQDLRDITKHLSEQTESFLQNLTEAVQDSLAEGERFFNSTR
jgi:chromosome segregation ATPase